MTGNRRRSLAPLIVYAICVLFVVSFILFEVLDIDGSNFRPMPVGRSAVRAVTAEEHVEDLKRSLLQVTALISWAAPGARLELPTAALAVEAVTDRWRPAIAPSLRCRIALPRSSLSDTAPA
jgi:hypothetical protein